MLSINILKIQIAVVLTLLLSACSWADEENFLVTIEEAPNVIIKTSVSGVGFDIPLNYFYRGYTKGYGWMALPKEVIKGKKRIEEDFLALYVLYPDFTPVTKDNLPEFQKLGWGRMIRATFTHFRQWGYDYNRSFEFDQSGLLPEDPKVPGMFHYYRNKSHFYTRYNYNASHDRIAPDQTEIRCKDQAFFKHKSPACELRTTYRPSLELRQLAGIDEDRVWELKITFSVSYLSQWKVIDRHFKELFDQFLKAATGKD